MFKSPSFKKILFAILLHALLPTLFFVVYMTLGQRETAQTTYENNLAQIAKFSTDSLEREFSKSKTLLSVLSQLPVVQNQDSTACDALANLLVNSAAGHMYTRIGAADAQGNVFCLNLPYTPPLNIADTDYFAKVSQNHTFTLGGYSVSKTTSSPEIVAAQPIFNSQDEFTGLVGAAIDLTWLDQFASRIDLSPDHTLTLIDESGVILARHPDPQDWVGRDSTAQPLGRRILATAPHKSHDIFYSSCLDHVDRLYAFDTIESTIGSGKYYLAVGSPKSAVEQFKNRHVIKNALVFVTLVLISMTIMAIDLNRFTFPQLMAGSDPHHEPPHT